MTPIPIAKTLLDYRPLKLKNKKPSQDDVLFLAFKDYFEADKTVSNNYKERIPNWFGTNKDYTRIDKILTPNIIIASENCAKNYIPPYTAMKIENIPIGNTWVRFRFTIEGPTYDCFVKQHTHFWVDGPNRVRNQIIEEDLPIRGYLIPDSETFFDELIKNTVTPKSYEVVIFQSETEGVDSDIICKPISGEVSDVTLFNPEIVGKACHFVANPKDFWIDLCFKTDIDLINSITTKNKDIVKNHLMPV